MSKTISNGVVGPEYWEYAATVISGILEMLASGQYTEIPRGILDKVQKFFKIVLKEETGDSIFDDSPLAQTSAMVMADEILFLVLNKQVSREEADRYYKKFLKLLDVMGKSRFEIGPKKETVRELAQFFRILQRKGEEQRSAEIFPLRRNPTYGL